MKKRKSLFSVLSSVLVIMCLFSLTMLPAFASNSRENNHGDTPFYFSFSGTKQQTAWRAKTDDSNVYMKVENVGAQFTAHVIGSNNSTTNSTGTDCSRGYTYTVSAPGEYRMRNWVHDGPPSYTYAAIYAAPTYGYSYYANGVWSPDSV